MQDGRYSINKSLYLIGMISLVIAMGLFMFASYLFAFLFWGLVYNVPAFIVSMQDYLSENFGFTNVRANLFIFGIFFLPSVFLGWISYWASNRIDSELPSITDEMNKSKLRSIPVDFVIQFIRFLIVVIGVSVIIYGIRWLFFA